jgi:MFS family permease
MTRILCALFFLSGAAALLFETLWFHQAGLTFGNSVWASAIVLSSFMAGLALGNGLMARFGSRVRRPVRFYALLEAVIGVGGVALVFVLPALSAWLAPVFRPFLEQPLILNPLRLGAGFLLLLLPATAMGATLPVLVKALLAHDPNFGSVLGRLYGWNTLGAVVGAVAGEAALVEWFGIRGTALVAGALDGVAVVVALALSIRLTATGEAAFATPPEPTRARLTAAAWRGLGAAFCAGGILLAFEVVWFRFMHLFVHSGGLVFSLMLAVVLAGIGLGGFAGGFWLRRDPAGFRHAPVLALLSGALSAALYFGFSFAIAPYTESLIADPGPVLWLSFVLMFPLSFLSGILFPFIGAALHRDVVPETRAVLRVGGGLRARRSAPVGCAGGRRSRGSHARALRLRGNVCDRHRALPVRAHGGRLPAHFDRALGQGPRDGDRRGPGGSDRDHRLSPEGAGRRADLLPAADERLLHVVDRFRRPALPTALRLLAGGVAAGSEACAGHQLWRGIDGERARRDPQPRAHRRRRHLARDPRAE